MSAAPELWFANEADCRQYLIQLRWPEGFRCPQCDGRDAWRLRNARFECRACRRQTSVTAGTIFEGTRQPLRLWFQAMGYVTACPQGGSARALQRLLHLPSYQTAWVWLHKLRRAMAREDPLYGAVEVGTADVWSSREFEQADRGTIIIATEVAGPRIGRVRMRPFRNALPCYVYAFVEQCVASGSTIYTNGSRRYVGLTEIGYFRGPFPYGEHWGLTQDPGRRKHSATPHVDSVAEQLKRWLVGTHAGAVSHAQLGYYLDEFTFRFNARRCKDPGKLLKRLMQQALITAPVAYRGVVACSGSR